MSSKASTLNDSNISHSPERRKILLVMNGKIRAYLDARGLLYCVDANVASSSKASELPRDKARCYGILLNSIPETKMNVVTVKALCFNRYATFSKKRKHNG